MDFRFILPFTYLLASRLTDWGTRFFHFWYEWLINVILLWFFLQKSPTETFVLFLIGYICFISIYEIGYFMNDVYSIRYEQKPRKRLGENFNPNNLSILTWIGLRLVYFGVGTWYIQQNYYHADFLRFTPPLPFWQVWTVFYVCLSVVFYLHNTLNSKGLKTMTFLMLAYLRFWAPIFIFLQPDQLSQLSLAVFVNYVFYRTLTYMESKDLLSLPERKLPLFKIRFYLLLFLLSLVIAFIQHTTWSLILNAYYLFFWFIYWAKAGFKNVAGSAKEEA